MYPRNTHWHRRYEIDGYEPRRSTREQLFQWTRCCGGKASSQANPQTSTTTGTNAPVIAGSSGTAYAAPGSIAVGSSGKYLEQGAIDLSNLSDPTFNITSADPAVVQSSLDAVNNFATQLVTATKSTDANLASLAQTVQTGGQSAIQPTVKLALYGGLGVAALVIVMILWRHK